MKINWDRSDDKFVGAALNPELRDQFFKNCFVIRAILRILLFCWIVGLIGTIIPVSEHPDVSCQDFMFLIVILFNAVILVYIDVQIKVMKVVEAQQTKDDAASS